MLRKLSIVLVLLTACGGSDEEPTEQLAPQLGTGDKTAASVAFTVIANTDDGLNAPRDLDFNPLRPEELWVVNFADDSVTIVFDTPSDSRTSEKRIDGYALHFMEEVTGIDFGRDETTIGKPGTFATCGESRNTYNGQAPGNDFMGPALWSSDLTVFAMMDPNGLGSHLDMLHNTPLCMGIVHEAENRYWNVGGLTGAIELYDFVEDDGIGNDDHFDGKTWRYAEDSITYQEGVPNHLALDGETGLLYIADGGNGRIARFDTQTGNEGELKPGLETPIQMMDGAVVEDFYNDPAFIYRPTGIELHQGILFVSDRDSGYLLAIDQEGTLLNYLDTGLGGGTLAGLTVGPDGKVYFVDTVGNRILRVDVAAAE